MVRFASRILEIRLGSLDRGWTDGDFAAPRLRYHLSVLKKRSASELGATRTANEPPDTSAGLYLHNGVNAAGADSIAPLNL
jgi:hypothetical protein